MTTPERRLTESQQLAEELNTPAPPALRWRRPLLTVARLATWAVMTPPRASLRVWTRLRPVQQLVAGFALYSVIGAILLCMPFAQAQPARAIDNAFNAVSAISTTGLTTVRVSDTYTFFGEFVLLALFQVGGVGFLPTSAPTVRLSRGSTRRGSRASSNW